MCVFDTEKNLLQFNLQMACCVSFFSHFGWLSWDYISVYHFGPCTELNTCECNQQSCSLEWVEFTRKIDARSIFFFVGSVLCEHFGRMNFAVALLHFQLRVNKTHSVCAPLLSKPLKLCHTTHEAIERRTVHSILNGTKWNGWEMEKKGAQSKSEQQLFLVNMQTLAAL